MKKPQGFTLIELLVVIAVIALLMSILLPSLSRAREQAKKIVCSAHTKGLGVALLMYADDYDRKTHHSPNRGMWDNAYQNPSTVTPFGPNHDFAYWGVAYLPYASSKKIFRCPGTRRPDDWPEEGWGIAYQEYFKYCSYGINGYVTWNSSENRNIKIDHDFKKHDEVIVFQDHIEQKLDGIGSDMFCIGPGTASTSHSGGQAAVCMRATGGYDTVGECFRHVKTSGTCWLDGHVSAIKESTGEDVPTSWYTGVQGAQ